MMSTQSLSDSTRLELVELLMSSIQDRAAFRRVLERLAQVYRASAVSWFSVDFADSSNALHESIGIDEADWRRYERHYAKVNPWIQAQVRKVHSGDVVSSDQLVPLSALQKTEYYADWLRPLGLLHGIGAVVECVNDQAAKLSILRGPEQGAATEEETTFLRRLAPHFLALWAWERQRSLLLVQNQLLQSAVSHLPFGVALFDRTQRITELNDAALEIVRRGDAVFVSAHRELRLQAIASEKAVHESMRLASSGAQVISALHRIERPRGAGFYLIQCIGSRAPIGANLPKGGGVIFLLDSSQTSHLSAKDLANALRLTRAEGEFVRCLLHGLSIRETAARLSITEDSARFVSKRIYAKTGTHGCSELLRSTLCAVWSLPRALPQDGAPASRLPTDAASFASPGDELQDIGLGRKADSIGKR